MFFVFIFVCFFFGVQGCHCGLSDSEECFRWPKGQSFRRNLMCQRGKAKAVGVQGKSVSK